MNRVTIKQLDALVNQINKETGQPLEYCKKLASGVKTNIGHYCLSETFGSIELQQIVNESGAINVIFYTTSKRELFNLLHAFLKGLKTGQSL